MNSGNLVGIVQNADGNNYCSKPCTRCNRRARAEMKRLVKSVVNNGVQIPNECTCIWCGSKMNRGGAIRIGVGVNSFALWCDNCGAVVVHACAFGKKITGYEVKWDVK